MGEVIRLAPPAVSTETVKALEDLLEQARDGRIVGVVWVCIRPGLRYEGDIAGEARETIDFTRGALLALNDELGQLIRRKS